MLKDTFKPEKIKLGQRLLKVVERIGEATGQAYIIAYGSPEETPEEKENNV